MQSSEVLHFHHHLERRLLDEWSLMKQEALGEDGQLHLLYQDGLGGD